MIWTLRLKNSDIKYCVQEPSSAHKGWYRDSLQGSWGVKRAKPFAKYNEWNVVVVVFCYNHTGENVLRERGYSSGATEETTVWEKVTAKEKGKLDESSSENSMRKIDKYLTMCYNIYNI